MDKYNRITSIHQQQNQLAVQITIQQNEIVAGAARAFFVDAPKAMWNAYVHSNELAVEEQYRKDMATKHAIESEIERWKDNPADAVEFFLMIKGTITTYGAYVAFAANPTVGATIWLIDGIFEAVWGALSYYGVIDSIFTRGE